MKILMLCRLYLPHLGGVEKHVEGLSSVLLKKGYAIQVITEKHDSKLPDKENINGVMVHRIPKQSLVSKITLWKWMWNHKEIFGDADVIHIHDVFWWYFPLRFIYLTKPVFMTFHGYENVDGPKLGSVIVRKCSELLSRGSICIGAWMRKWYSQKPSAISYGAASSKQMPLPKKLSAVFIGRLDADTGVVEYIEGTILLGGRISLDIYGAGALAGEIGKRIKASKYIHLHEPTKDAQGILAKHRFVFASQYLTMLEAQQMGRQVVSFSSTPLKQDYLAAFPTFDQLITFRSASELATRLKELINKPELERQNIRQARIWAAKQTWKKLADQYESLWQT